jgi:hypothetical protein
MGVWCMVHTCVDDDEGCVDDDEGCVDDEG